MYITLLSDTDIFFGLFNLFIYLFWYTFWVIVSNTLYVKEILKIYLIEQKIHVYPNHQDEWYVYHSDWSRYVSDCTVSWFWANQSLLYLLNAAWLAENK
jgi:hypothetical protein